MRLFVESFCLQLSLYIIGAIYDVSKLRSKLKSAKLGSVVNIDFAALRYLGERKRNEFYRGLVNSWLNLVSWYGFDSTWPIFMIVM